MKKTLLTLCCVIAFSMSYAQSNLDIAKVYIKRANTVIEESIDYEEALTLFEKAIKYMDTITSPNVASLGAMIYFESNDLKSAKKYSAQYFLLAKNKKSEDFQNQLELAVSINDALEIQLAEEKKLEEERIKKEKELKRIDSLKTIWKAASEKFVIKADSIYYFNKNNYALYSKDGKFGVINDVGDIFVEASEFVYGVSFEGYILLQNKKENPNKVFYFNTYNGIGSMLPNPSDFNPISTHFGKVMLPRSNGRLVTYPNNSYEPMVFDLNLKRIVKVSNEQNLLKTLKKEDIIRKYNKDGEVRIDKDWYVFGGHLGGGIHPLYLKDNYNINAYLFSVDGTVSSANSKYKYLGAFHNSKLEALKAGTRVWLNQNGTKVDDLKDEMVNYEGNSKVVKLEKGAYQIFKGEKIIKGTESLEKMVDYLRKFN